MPPDVHRSVRGNYLRLPVFLPYFLVVLCLFSFVCRTHSSQMGEQCDFTANGLSATTPRGVTPVYLRCSQGQIRWTFPRGALRVLLRLPGADRDFRGCLRTTKGFAGARIFIEGSRSLAPLLALGDGGHPQLVRCFVSTRGQAALYVEASDDHEAYSSGHIAEFSYDLQPIPHNGTIKDLIGSECRPCSQHELAHAYCTSDLVTRGTIVSVDDVTQLEQAHIKVRVRRTLRNSTPANSPLDEHVNYVMPSHCQPQHGHGEFVLMGRQRLGDLTLTCAASLSQWAQTVATMNADGSAHCVLTS